VLALCEECRARFERGFVLRAFDSNAAMCVTCALAPALLERGLRACGDKIAKVPRTRPERARIAVDQTDRSRWRKSSLRYAVSSHNGSDSRSLKSPASSPRPPLHRGRARDAQADRD